MTDKKTAKTEGPEFLIHRIYLKDMSFESPASPKVFQTQWEPDVNVELSTKAEVVEDNIQEVVLHVTVTVKLDEQLTFLAEVQQAGIFTIKGVEGDDLAHMLASFCPNILFPYAREAISDTVTRGGFPQLLLAPVNFDALYAQHTEQQSASVAASHSQNTAKEKSTSSAVSS